MSWPPRFCADCGAPLDTPTSPEAPAACGRCGARRWRASKPCAGVLPVREGRVLLGRRKLEPRAGAWDLIGGFLHAGEAPEEGARREAREETGLDALRLELLGIWVDRYDEGDPARDEDYGGDHTFNVYYLATLAPGTPRPQDDVAELRWFGPGELPEELAFPHERAVLEAWRKAASGEGDQVRGRPPELS